VVADALRFDREAQKNYDRAEAQKN